MRLVIMQPYFAPYTGYLRLFQAADLFVIYDCVQFPARSWVHRNRFMDTLGRLRWLTLPLEKCSQKTAISHLRFAKDSVDLMTERLRPLPHIRSPFFEEKNLPCLYDRLLNPSASVVDYLEGILQPICSTLDLPFNTIRSSSLGIDPVLKGQDRILEICRHLKAKTYINSPNGRALYCPEAFKKSGVDLQFLPSYEGSYVSILHRLLTEERTSITDDIRKQTPHE